MKQIVFNFHFKYTVEISDQFQKIENAVAINSATLRKCIFLLILGWRFQLSLTCLSRKSVIPRTGRQINNGSNRILLNIDEYVAN